MARDWQEIEEEEQAAARAQRRKIYIFNLKKKIKNDPGEMIKFIRSERLQPLAEILPELPPIDRTQLAHLLERLLEIGKTKLALMQIIMAATTRGREAGTIKPKEEKQP